MAVNKVVYNRRTLIDLTADTVSKETLKKDLQLIRPMVQ